MGILSPEAVTRLWDEQSAALVLYARQWCDTPEDVVQEAFLLLVRQAAAPGQSRGMDLSGGAESGDQRGTVARAAVAPRGRGGRPRRAVVRSHRRRPAGRCRGDRRLETSADQEREAIIARLWGGLSFEEIALTSGNSLSTVYRCYQRGLAALRERLGGSCLTKKRKRERRPEGVRGGARLASAADRPARSPLASRLAKEAAAPVPFGKG